MNRMNRKSGVSMSDGYSISGILTMIPDQRLVARNRTGQLIPEFSPDSFRPSFQDFFHPSFQDSRHLPTNHFVYAPNITIQNVIPDYSSHKEPRMHRLDQSETNHPKKEGGRNGFDDQTSPDQRKYPGGDADIEYNHPRHRRSFIGNHYADMGCMRNPPTQNHRSRFSEQEYLDMHSNGIRYSKPDDYRYPKTNERPSYPARDGAVGYPVSRTSGIRQNDYDQFCKRCDPSAPNPQFDENRRYTSHRLIDDPVDEKSYPEPGNSYTPYYEYETQEEGHLPEADPRVPEGDLPDINADRTPEGDLDPNDQPVGITSGIPVTVSLTGDDGDQPEEDITENDHITEAAEEIPEPAAVDERDQVTGGTTERDVYPPSSEADLRGPQTSKKSFFSRLLSKRGRKNKIIQKDAYQQVPDEKGGNKEINESDLENKEKLTSPKLSDAKKKKGKSDKPAAAPQFNPENTKGNSDGTAEKKKTPSKNRFGNLRVNFKKKTQEAKAKLQKSVAAAKRLLKKAVKKPTIKNPFKKKKK